MKNMEPKDKAIIFNLFKQSLKKTRLCLADNCNNNSINSHILQKNGFLDIVAENGHIAEIGIHFFDEDLFKFKKIGVNNAFVFPGFCDFHDTDIFKTIETTCTGPLNNQT